METSRFENISSEHKGSFDWLHNEPSCKYEEWVDFEDSSLLLVKGKPGSGKSTLCKYVRRSLRETFRKRSTSCQVWEFSPPSFDS